MCPQQFYKIRRPNGLYRINVSGRSDLGIFNGAADKVVISGGDLAFNLRMSYSKPGSIVIKELYCGGFEYDIWRLNARSPPEITTLSAAPLNMPRSDLPLTLIL